MIKQLQHETKGYKNAQKAQNLSRFFKTGKGEYGEGDVFYGISVPTCRKIAKKYAHVFSLVDTKKLLASKIHEERLTALLILIEKNNKATDFEREQIVALYLSNTEYINNWDLIDLSAPKIVGEYLYQKQQKDPQYNPMDVLVSFAKSDNMWKKRIAMLATYAFILHGDAEPTFAIARILLFEKHDLIQKAVGWMLREVGKRVSQRKEEAFLKENYDGMARTTLRYAIERFDEKKKKKYMYQ